MNTYVHGIMVNFLMFFSCSWTCTEISNFISFSFWGIYLCHFWYKLLKVDICYGLWVSKIVLETSISKIEIEERDIIE